MYSLVFISVGLVFVLLVRLEFIRGCSLLVLLFCGFLEVYRVGSSSLFELVFLPIGKVSNILVCLFSFFSVIGLSCQGLEGRIREYILVILVSVLGSFIVALGNDLIVIYLGIELSGLSFIVLSGLGAGSLKGSVYRSEAGLKYYIFSGFSTGVLLLGLFFIQSYFGVFCLSSVGELVRSVGGLSSLSVVGQLGFFLFTFGICMKLGIYPVYFWFVDVVSGSFLGAGTYLMVASKIALLFFLVRWSLEGFIWFELFMVFSIGCLLLGGFGAARQRLVMRFLAYSGLSHMGYLFMVIGLGSISSIYSFILYMVVYSFSSIVLLLLVNYLGFRYIDELGFLSRDNFWFGSLVFISVLSLSGVPPLLGFFVKYSMLLRVVSVGKFFWVGLAIVSSVVSFWNYLDWFRLFYYGSGYSRGFLGLGFLPYRLVLESSVLFLAFCLSFALLFGFGFLF